MEQNKNTQVTVSHKDILTALDMQFSTNVNAVYINSLKCNISFRDVTVKEQKTLTKLAIDHENNANVLYESTLAMIASLMIKDDASIDIMKLDEFDRNKIMIALYRQNFLNDNVVTKCEKCKSNIKYTINYDQLIEKMNTFDTSDRVVSKHIGSHTFEATIGFPNVAIVKEYMKELTKDKTFRKDRADYSKITHMEYLDLFIKRIKILNSVSNDEIEIDMSKMNIREVEEVLEKLPQPVLFGENIGIMNDVNTIFMTGMNNISDTVVCPECGETVSISIGISDFFGQ